MNISEQELKQLIRLAKKILWDDPEVKRTIQAAGVNVIPANFYSNVPSVEEIESSFEYGEAQLQRGGPYSVGGLFDADRITDFVRGIMAYSKEFNPPRDGDAGEPAGFFWRNPAFSKADAMAYYCVLRTLRPERVLEIGSGFSTLVADQAIRRNGSGELILIEPYPKPFLRDLPSVARLIERPVQQIPELELVELVNSCRVWFIDSTHTVKIGSDCLYIYLKIMPQVTSRVMCHSHDIALPYGMPKGIALKKNVFWTEQYLLHAYLLDNPKARVYFGSTYLHEQLAELSAEFMGGSFEDGGGSLWYELNGPGPSSGPTSAMA